MYWRILKFITNNTELLTDSVSALGRSHHTKKVAVHLCCGAGFRWWARPLDGAVESAPPNTWNSDRYPRISPKGTGPLQDRGRQYFDGVG